MSVAVTESQSRSRSDTIYSPPTTRPSFVPNGSPWSPHPITDTMASQKGRNDIHVMDPDEIFAKYTVSEVKSIMHKLRSDVDAKQEELRLMVGERYRDLLQASTSIIAMSESARGVVQLVAEMKQIVMVASPDERANMISRKEKNEDTHLQVLQCLAAHVKLLLDASEHLWRLLERKRYFQATWLFLLCRVVYRSLVSEDAERQNWGPHGVNVKEHFPLVQRQWETVAQFRVQISHKATLALREHAMTSEDICGSLLALHFLDSLPLTDALDVFLKQRTRSLQILYDAIHDSWNSPPSNMSKDNENNGKTGRGTWEVVLSVLTVLVGTVETAQNVFREDSGGSHSTICQVLAFTQSNSHGAENSPVSHELRLSTQSLLASLPNANHFLPLPAEIRSYRPYIDLKSPSSSVDQAVLNAKLRDWFSRATGRLHESAGAWLSRLDTIKKVSVVRNSAFDWLSSPKSSLGKDFIDDLRVLVDDVCKTRFEDIWKLTLDKISTNYIESLCRFAKEIAELREESELDVSPPKFLLSASPAISAAQFGLGSPFANSSFERFKETIKHRIDGMTPLLSKVMSELETSATRLRDDVGYTFIDGERRSQLGETYTAYSVRTIGRLLDGTESLISKEEGDSEQSVRRLVFIGRAAQKLSISAMITDLSCPQHHVDNSRSQASRLFNMSVKKWSASAARSAHSRLLSGFGANCRFPLAESPSVLANPSSHLISALLSLIYSTLQWGFFREHVEKSIVVEAAFGKMCINAVRGIEGGEVTPTPQFVWDLHLLKQICGEWGTALADTAALLEKAICDCQQKLLPAFLEGHPRFEEEIQDSLKQTMAHSLLLFSPLLPTMVPSSTVKSPKSSKFETNRLKMGNAPPTTAENMLTLSLVKPSPRFGLLWVGTSETR